LISGNVTIAFPALALGIMLPTAYEVPDFSRGPQAFVGGHREEQHLLLGRSSVDGASKDEVGQIQGDLRQIL